MKNKPQQKYSQIQVRIADRRRIERIRRKYRWSVVDTIAIISEFYERNGTGELTKASPVAEM